MRHAEKQDIPELLSIATKFVAQVPHPIESDAESVAYTLEQLIDGDDGCLIVSDDLKSVIGGMVFPYHFNRNHVAAQELFWWVDEKDRKSGLGKKLFEAFMDWVTSKKATTLHMIALSNESHDIAENMYKKQGFNRLETTYVKVI